MLTTFLLLFFVTSASLFPLNKDANTGGKDKYDLIQELKQQIKSEQAELEKEEKMNKNFERLVQFVNFLGQVDSFLSERAKILIKKLAVLTQEEEDMYTHRSNK